MSEEKTTEQLLEEELKGGSDPADPTGSEDNGQDPNNPDPSNPEGGKGGEETPTPKKYKVLDREVDSDELYSEFSNSQEYIKKLEAENAEFKKGKPDPANPEDPNRDKPENAPLNLDPKDEAVIKELKRLGFTRQEDVASMFTEKEKDIVSKAVSTTAARTEVMSGLAQLEEDFDGSLDETLNVQKPKVERSKILNFIKENPGVNMSLLDIAQTVYREDFIKYEARKLSVNPNPVPRTEDNGLGNAGNPPAPKKFSFKDNSVESGLEETLGLKS